MVDSQVGAGRDFECALNWRPTVDAAMGVPPAVSGVPSPGWGADVPAPLPHEVGVPSPVELVPVPKDDVVCRGVPIGPAMERMARCASLEIDGLLNTLRLLTLGLLSAESETVGARGSQLSSSGVAARAALALASNGVICRSRRPCEG